MVRILTANLFNGRASASSFAAVLDEMRPDVVAAQELAPDVAAVIARRLPHGLLHPALDFGGIGLAAADPIDVTRRPLPHRDALAGRLETPNGPLRIWSVHLANPIDKPPVQLRRRAQVAALEAALVADQSSGEPVVVVGDLNATPMWPAYRRLRRHLDDGVAGWAGAAGKRPPRTWAYRPGISPMLRIDHALTSGVTVTGVQTVVVAGSDHRALVVDVE